MPACHSHTLNRCSWRLIIIPLRPSLRKHPVYYQYRFVYISKKIVLPGTLSPSHGRTMHVSAVQAHPSTWIIPLHGVPGGLVGYPRAYQNQFREFNSHRVHILVATFLCIKKMNSGKRESVSWQHSMKIDELWEC